MDRNTIHKGKRLNKKHFLNGGGELRCSRRMGGPCYTCGTRRVTLD